MEGKHAPGTVFDISIIRKTGELPGGLIGKADFILGGYIFEGAVGIASGLPLDHSDVLAQLILLRFNHTNGLPINKKSIVNWPGTGGIFPNSNTERSHGIHFFQILNDPAGLRKTGIDQLSGSFFRGHVGRLPAQQKTNHTYILT
ncbi:hypothetical protein [Vescimonas sp.]|uniref:hypothetical protein n=1 Tax=Vescimonas sp. TaxID=2892404 RepID=UPI0030779228